MALWTSAEAVAATGGQTPCAWTVDGVSIDTRTLQKGDLFVALKAARDGHDFVAQALAAGAGAALVDHIPEGVPADAPLLLVDDVLQGLVDLGQAGRARSTARIVAVTGSVGKTSTKEMLKTVLECQGRTHASVASYNNHWGVPLTLARMPQDTEFGIFEVGMNHPGEIGPLSDMVQPHVAMVTTVAAAHLEAFENIEGIALEKAQIVSGLGANGAAVLPADIETSGILVDAARDKGAVLIGFGTKAEAYRIINVTITDDSTLIRAQLRGAPALIKLSSPGRHFASNALGAIAVVEALGGDPGRAAIDMARWSAPQGRGQRQRVQLDAAREDSYIDLIDDAYNANPTSMVAALEVLAHATPRDHVERAGTGRRIAILGDMLELGPQEGALHAGISATPSVENLDVIHCVGPRMRHLHDALAFDVKGQWFENAEDMASVITEYVGAGDVVMVKGSKGSLVSRIVDALQKLGHR